MKEKIKNIKLIPDWFDLKKYEAGKNQSLIDWALNLSVRKEIGMGICPNNLDDEFREYAEHKFALIKNHGFISRQDNEDSYELAKGAFNLKEIKPGFGLVYPLPLSRSVEIYDSILGDTKLRNRLAIVDDLEIFDEQRTEPLDDRDEALREWYEEFFQVESYDQFCCGDYADFSPHICVDLGAPDETLVEAFKDWLKATRKNAGCEGANLPGKVSVKLIDRWDSSAILPYLDLLIYQRLEGVTLPAHVIGNAIFPVTADFDTTEAVRKTTRPNAEKALMQAHGIMRHALIADELQKNGKKIG